MIIQTDHQIIENLITKAVSEATKSLVLEASIGEIMLTPDEVCSILKIEKTKLLRRIELKKYYVGKEVRYKQSDVQKYINGL